MKNAGTASVTPGVDVLLLDNRDSFTWNLAQGFRELGASVDVVDSDDASAAAVIRAAPKLVCIGPGPRGPAQLPHLTGLVKDLAGALRLFGVCLGMQVLVRAYGGEIARAKAPVHGKRDLIESDGTGVFAGLPRALWVMRYHSLVAIRVPERFVVTARDKDGQAMAMRDVSAAIEAVQFHPESIGTAGGLAMLRNALVGAGVAAKDVVVRRGGVPGPESAGPGHPEALYGRAPSD